MRIEYEDDLNIRLNNNEPIKFKNDRAEKSYVPIESLEIFETEEAIDYSKIQCEIDNEVVIERSNHIFDEVFEI